MRRSLAIVAISAMVALAGCTGTASPSPSQSSSSTPATTAPTAPPATAAATTAPVSGSIGFVYGAFAPQSQWETYFKDFLAANPGVTITYIPVSLDKGWGDYTDKIATLVASGQKIDVIWSATEGVGPFAEKNVLKPLDSLMAQDAADPALVDFNADVAPDLLKALQWKGKQYELPFAWNDMEIWYNTALFSAAGVTPPSTDWSSSWTWDDYLAAAQKITKPGVYGAMVDTGWFNVEAWMYSNGTSMLNSDLTAAQMTDPKVEETLQFLQDLVWKYKVSPQPSATSVNDLFLGSKVAMFGAGRWPMQAIKPAGFTTYDVAPFPKKTTAATVMGSDGYGVTANSTNPDAAWALVKYMTSKSVMQALVPVTAASGSIPARKSLATGSDMAPPAGFSTFYGSLAVAQPVQAGPHYSAISAIFDRYMSKIMANEMTVDAACQAMQQEMTAEFAK